MNARFLTRLWFYFRIGYSTYLTFILGALNTLIVVWYLAIQQAPEIESFFGHFVPFAIATTVIGVPSSIFVGWVHYKRTSAFASEVDIQTEANPYYYKLFPGKEEEVVVPMYLELLQSLRRLMQSEHLLSEEDISRIEGLESKMRHLMAGGMVGTPRRRRQRTQSVS